MSEIRSERVSLAAILTMCNALDRIVASVEASCGDVVTMNDMARLSMTISAIREEARALHQQVMHGTHTNPPLAVYLNPPRLSRTGRVQRWEAGGFKWVGRLSKNLHEIRYTHQDDGKDYKHDFGSGAEMWAISRDGVQEPGDRAILIIAPGGAWDDFD